jgi:hypothetical protein
MEAKRLADEAAKAEKEKEKLSKLTPEERQQEKWRREFELEQEKQDRQR